MEELLRYRKKLMDKLVSEAREFRAACLRVVDPYAPVEGGWNVHQLAVHARDVDKLVYGLRARRTINEDNPEFQNFDGDGYMAEHYNPQEALQSVLDELVANVDSLINELRRLPAKDWKRESRHATQGSGLSLQLWVERGLGHIEEHMATVKKSEQTRS